MVVRALVVACLAACAQRVPAPTGDRCADLRRLAVPHVTIDSARVVPADEYTPPAHPAYCRVDAIAHPTADSNIRFEVAIPVGDAWTGRYQQIGNGGFAGLVPEGDLVQAVALGNAAAGTDDGHASTRGVDASFAVGHPERVIDFGYRAVHETHDAALAIIEAYAGRAPQHRYFTGCSDGGREGLMEAQRFPADFDGIVAGAPANYTTRLLSSFAWNANALEATPGSYISSQQLRAIEDAALAACGGKDGVIDDPRACHFDPSVLRCTGAPDDHCLSDAQLVALAKIYAGMPGYYGLTPGSEAEDGAWAVWITGSAPGAAGHAVARRFGATFFRYLVHGDSHFELRDVHFDRDVAAAEQKLGAILDASSPDLSAFARRGGKLIQWHGWSDPAIPARASIAYHDAVARRGDPSAFYRLFLVPGMLHCEGGRGPSDVPTLDAIEAWVEHGRAPAELVVKNTTRSWTLRPY